MLDFPRRSTRARAARTALALALPACLAATTIAAPAPAQTETTVAPPPVIVVPPPPPTTTLPPPTTVPDTLPPATTAPPVTATPLVPSTAEATPTAPPAPVPTTRPRPTTTRPKPRPTTTYPARPTRTGTPRVDESVPKKVPSGATYIEVDISQQRLYLYKGGTLFRTVRVSTGNGKRFCEKGKCGVAYTPRGRFRVQRRINGWRESYLGKLYNPLYFSGGYAIHGSLSVPSYPASHGCVRVSMTTAKWLPSVVPNGTPVYVHD